MARLVGVCNLVKDCVVSGPKAALKFAIEDEDSKVIPTYVLAGAAVGCMGILLNPERSRSDLNSNCPISLGNFLSIILDLRLMEKFESITVIAPLDMLAS